jgi:FixJ family two-component response regulator
VNINPKEKGRVFVFDDDADSLQSVVAALRRDGFDVFPFADPREGLASKQRGGTSSSPTCGCRA